MNESSPIPAAALVLFLIAVVLIVIAGCGGSNSATEAENKGTDSKGKTVTEETLGVAVYSGTTPEEAYPGVYKMVTDDGFDEVIAFYKAELPDAVFSELPIPSGKGAAFAVSEGGFQGNVSVEENLPVEGKVTITVSRFNSE